MKIQKEYIRNPIIARLLAAQIFLMGLGFLAISLAWIAIDRFNSERQIEQMKKTLAVSIIPYEDQLLAWSQLGMVSAQMDLLEKLKSQLHLRNLKIINQEDLPLASQPAFTFILDSDLAKDLGKSVVVEMDPEQFRFSSISPSAGSLIALGLLALLTIFYSVYFIIQHVFKPIHHIRQNLEKLESAEEIKFDSTRTIGEIKDLINVIRRLYLKSMSIENERVRSQVAESVMHDIRSPLAALKVVQESSQDNLTKEQSKLLSMSIERITDIANTILPKKGKPNFPVSKNENLFLWVLVDQIVSEKRVQYKNLSDVEIVFNTEGPIFELNAICRQMEFMRAVSNIIDNAVEAKKVNQTLKIIVTLKSNKNKVILAVKDNGKGIHSENISKVFDEGFTFGKKNGSGLGLSQVKKSVESWDGNIEIQSTLNKDTALTIELKKSTCPLWLVNEIKIGHLSDILILDDEEYVFQILKDKFNRFNKTIKYFKFISDFKNHLAGSNNINLCFVDHDLKQEIRGLELIEQLKIQDTSILLTGNYDDRQVQKNSVTAGIKILPKPLIHEITIIS